MGKEPILEIMSFGVGVREAFGIAVEVGESGGHSVEQGNFRRVREGGLPAPRTFRDDRHRNVGVTLRRCRQGEKVAE